MSEGALRIESKVATSRPLLSLGLTFVLLGIGFGSPIRLAPHAPAHLWEGSISDETLNLYALTVFAGWAHFFYAWRGQWRGSAKMSRGGRRTYWLAVVGMLCLLIVARSLLGFAVFSLLAWVWNIAHFAKAERLFAGGRASTEAAYPPVIAFAWFTLCLFPIGILHDVRFVFAGSVLLAAYALASGGWKMLASDEGRLPLLTMFLIGETMVWASYGKYMSDAFRVGVYVFHIAAASFFHYLSGYFYAESRGTGKDKLLRPTGIVGMNFAILVAGCAIVWLSKLAWLRPVFGLEAFTLFVALHLGASDLQPVWMRRSAKRSL